MSPLVLGRKSPASTPWLTVKPEGPLTIGAAGSLPPAISVLPVPGTAMRMYQGTSAVWAPLDIRVNPVAPIVVGSPEQLKVLQLTPYGQTWICGSSWPKAETEAASTDNSGSEKLNFINLPPLNTDVAG